MTTVATNALREDMIRRLRAGEADAFLTLSTAYISACPDDHYVRLMAIGEYLKIGLIRPAKELLEDHQTSGLLPPEFESVRESLLTVQDAAVSWSALSGRFETNLAALQERGVAVQPIREAWASAHRAYELFHDNRGLDQVRKRGETGRWQWVPRLGDHRAQAEAYPLSPDATSETPGPYLFEGLDLGWLFERIYRSSTDSFLGYSCALFVVEPDPAALAVVFHLRDWARMLSDPRVFFFTGVDCVADLIHVLENDANLPWPHHAFRLCGAGRVKPPEAVEAVESACRRQERAVRLSWNDLQVRYRSRDRSYWAKRFGEALSGEGKPLRILAAVSTHTTFLQYSMRDAKRAFDSLGYECVVLTEQAPYEIISPLTYHNAIRDLDPDLFFNIDHIRPEFSGIVPDNLPILTWDQDQLPQVFTRRNIEKIGSSDFVVGCSKSRCLQLGAKSEQFLQAQVPTCPQRFGGEALTDDERGRYACDVSYVSHASQTPKEFHEYERAACKNESLVRVLDELYERTPSTLAEHRVMCGNVALMLIEEATRQCGLVIQDDEVMAWLRNWYLWRLGDRVFRHEGLEWVASWAERTERSFRIYGKGWDGHPTLSPYAAGPAENGHELVCIHRASKINLQLMPAGFIHQRALDGLASGGFFLSRRTPGDSRGRTLRLLDTRIRELEIQTTAQLVDSADEEVQRLLQSYRGKWLHRLDRHRNTLLDDIRIAAEILHPDELFPNFEDILFDSSEEYADVADRFLEDEPRRRVIAAEMRRIVVERLSYTPTMDRFLHAMTDYLGGNVRSAATDGSS